MRKAKFMDWVCVPLIPALPVTPRCQGSLWPDLWIPLIVMLSHKLSMEPTLHTIVSPTCRWHHMGAESRNFLTKMKNIFISSEGGKWFFSNDISAKPNIKENNIFSWNIFTDTVSCCDEPTFKTFFQLCRLSGSRIDLSVKRTSRTICSIIAHPPSIWTISSQSSLNILQTFQPSSSLIVSLSPQFPSPDPPQKRYF